MLTPNTAAQRVAAFIATATPASFASKVGGSAATPNQLGRAVTGYTGHSRIFTGVRQLLRNAGYRANPQWPALTLAQWQAVHGVQAQLGSKATAKQLGSGRARVGKVLASASKASGAPVPRNVLPPLAATRTQGSGARAAANAAPSAPAAPPSAPVPAAPAPTPAAGS